MVIITIFAAVFVFQNRAFSAETTTKIMPLGDSITACGNWRQLLLSNLTSSGYNVEFVGSQNYLTPHEGHSGIGPIGLATTGDLKNWLSTTNPQIVIMHLGTNNSWGNNQAPEIISSFTTLVSQMRANNPNMKIMVAKIIPMHPTASGESCNNNVIDLNSRIDDWAKGLSTTQSPIIVVDQYTGFDTTTDTYDGVHPNDSGCIKMADKWFAALKDVLNPFASATPSASATPTPTSTSLIGDVDGNENVNSIDFGYMRKYLLGLITEFPNREAGIKAADIDGNGTFNSIDFGHMRNFLIGKGTIPPASAS